MELTDEERAMLAWACTLAAEHERTLAADADRIGGEAAVEAAEQRRRNAARYDELAGRFS